MLQKFKDRIGCIQVVGQQVCYYLAKGDYNGQKLYFIGNTGCLSCAMAPLEEGYNCNNEKVKIDDFKKLKNVEQVKPKS